MAGPVPRVESPLARLIERLLTAAENALATGDAESARAMAEEVRAVDPDNPRADRLVQRLEARQLGPSGERALMTLLFSDLVGSTMLSERVEPEQLRDLFSFYRNAARDAVGRYGGSLIQFSGDGILAGFGYPEPHEDDARRAVLAGLDLVVAMRDARSDLEHRLGLTAEVRVGIHTGLVVVTDLSAESVAERDSIVGVTPNLASRVQNAAEPDSVVISDVTRQLVDTDFYLESLGEQQLKGISRAVEIFAVQRPRYAAARFEAERYHRAGLVGRAGPSSELLEAWQSVREHREPPGERSFLLVGEAGIGKSRLVAALLDRVEATGGKVVGIGCLPYYASVSLWPVARMLERVLDLDAADRLGSLERHLSGLGLELSRSVPFLGSLVGVADPARYPAPELDPAAFLDETINCLLDWLRALAQQAPLLFVVEDLHWADPSTNTLLGRLVGHPAAPHPGTDGSRVLTVATTRQAPSLSWVGDVRVLQLERLDAAAAAQLVENLGGEGLTEAARASIVEQTDGVPLFIEELTRSYLGGTRVEPVPLRLQELFTWRFKAPGVDLRVVQVAATVGPAFDAATVAGVLEDDQRVSDQMVALTRAGIIERGDAAAGSYRFRHALMRDAAYETQVLDVRRHTHAKVAEVLGARGAEPALVAQHLDLAGEAAQAIGLYLAAVQGEQARGAHTVATKLLTRVLELVETLPESAERDVSELTARLLRALSVSSMQGYAAPAVQADHRRAEVLATRLGNAVQVVPSLVAIWSYWLAAGDTPTSRRVIDRLSAMVSDVDFASFAPEVEQCVGFQEFFEGHLDLAMAHQERSFAGFSARPAEALITPFWPLPTDPFSVCLIGTACLMTLRGEPGALEWENRAIRRAEEIGFPRGPFTLAFVKLYAAWIRRFNGDHEDAQRLGAEIVAIGQEHGYAFWSVMGMAYATAEAPGSAAHRQALQQTFDTLHLMGQEAFKPFALGHLAELHAAAGELDRAQELVGDALLVVQKSGEYVHLPELLRQRAAYTIATGGDTADAAADLTEAVRCASEQGAHVARLRAAVDLAGLQDGARPASWRRVLVEARGCLPAGLVNGATAAADALLEG
ncbi:ATP-binding protein [Monashia sp. NPDC004114]